MKGATGGPESLPEECKESSAGDLHIALIECKVALAECMRALDSNVAKKVGQ